MAQDGGATATFAGPDEFRAVIDRAFTMMSEDPEMGPRLQAADVPQRFAFSDLGLVVNLRASRAGEQHCLHWEWSDDVDWEPRVRMDMSSQVANRYFQGRESIAVAIARRRIRAGGDLLAALNMLPLVKPLFPRYREVLAAEFPHLVAAA